MSSNSLYGDLLAASCVTQIAVAEESDLKVKMLKLIFQVSNNFSLFYILVINETDTKKSGFVLEMAAGMYRQSNGWLLVFAKKHYLVSHGTVQLNCNFVVVFRTQTGWGNAAWTSCKLLETATAESLLQGCGDWERRSEEHVLWNRGELLNMSFEYFLDLLIHTRLYMAAKSSPFFNASQ